MRKVDYKKDYKELYLPSAQPSILRVPSIPFALIQGQGDPNGEAFARDIGALYAFCYAVKMSCKSKEPPEGYFEYTVFPLEGVWDLVDKDKPATDKSNYAYSIMIRQPDFLNSQLFDRFLAEAKKKKPNPSLEGLRFVSIEEGLCCQMLHRGSYDSEPASFEAMQRFCREAGYERTALIHREIYLSDPRKTDPQKLKTVLRFSVREAAGR